MLEVIMSVKRDREDDEESDSFQEQLSTRPLKQQKSVTADIRSLVGELHFDSKKGQELKGTTTTVEEESFEIVSSAIASAVATVTSAGDNPVANIDEKSSEELTAPPTAEGTNPSLSALDDQVADDTVVQVDGVLGDVIDKTTDYVSDIVNDIEDGFDGGVQYGLHQIHSSGINVNVMNQSSVEEAPSNNVVISHPTLGMADPVPMGIHIKPVNYGEVAKGHEVVMVEMDGIADQAKLRVGDLLVAINGTDIKEKTFPEVLQLFGTISKTFSVTLIRPDRHASGICPEYLRLTITVELGLTDGNTVRIISIDLKTIPFMYSLTDANQVRISHKPGTNKIRKYLKADSDTTVTMESQILDSDQYNFVMSNYNSQKDGNAYTFCNVSNNRALDAENDGEHRIVMSDADDLIKCRINQQGTVNFPPDVTRKGTADNRFFFQRPTENENKFEFGLESVENTGYFLTYENNVLKLTHLKKGALPKECRFEVTPSTS